MANLFKLDRAQFASVCLFLSGNDTGMHVQICFDPVPALPPEAGFQGGAAPLGVPWGEAAKKRFAMGMSLGNGQLPRALQSAIRVRLPIPFRARRLCV